MFEQNRRYGDDGGGLRIVARVMFAIPAAVVYFMVHIARRIMRWHYSGVAQSWPAAEAKVTSSFQIDENQVAFSTNSWFDESIGSAYGKYRARWAVALQYSYEAEGESYAGTYFLPKTYKDGDLADDAADAWIDKTITVRYNHFRPKLSFFLVQDGAPGKPHIPRLLSW